MELRGKIAVVTGGTSGIGRVTVETFVREGAKVVFTGRRRELGEQVARATGALYVRADATLEEDAERTVREALAYGGGLDILVNNAGMGSRINPIENTSLAFFDKMIAVHLRGALAHMKHAVTPMRARGGGSIVSVSSIGALRAGFGALSYSAAKAGLNHMSRCAAMELATSRIRVNTVSPGVIATQIIGKSAGYSEELSEEYIEPLISALADFQPYPRAGLARDVAEALLYFASDRSEFVTGTDLVVDGALIAGRRPSEVAAQAAAVKSKLGLD